MKYVTADTDTAYLFQDGYDQSCIVKDDGKKLHLGVDNGNSLVVLDHQLVKQLLPLLEHFASFGCLSQRIWLPKTSRLMTGCAALARLRTCSESLRLVQDMRRELAQHF